MKEFFEQAAAQNHPLRVLREFLEKEESYKLAKRYELMRFVGYVLDISYDKVTIITSDPYKIAVGGIPRNSLLIMAPDNYDNLPPHFTLLRVLQTAPTPLKQEVAQTYFELQKKSMPELDVFTQSELQWGALETSVLGMFYPHPEKFDEVEFSGDVNNFVSAHKYRVYAPNDDLLDLIINSMVAKETRFDIGELRLTECRLPIPGKPQPNVTVCVSTKDFMGFRTAMFGKTRLGKSNVVKLIAQSIIETTAQTKNVGQLIFDIDGEYANDNPQDDKRSLASAYPDHCIVYALTQKPATPSRQLRINFYEHPKASHRVLRELLANDKRDSIYVRAFTELELPSIQELSDMEANERLRASRKILMYWAIIKKAGYDVDESTIRQKMQVQFNPRYRADLRDAAYQRANDTPPANINSLDELVTEFEALADYIFRFALPNDPLLVSDSGRLLFEADEKALLTFLKPTGLRAGPVMIQRFRKYHHKAAGDFIRDIIELIEQGKTVIIDLGNADEEVMKYFSDQLSEAIFRHQVDKFTNNALGNHYVQLYFEEAHNLFPYDDKKIGEIYAKIAKEGAKYHIGMVYSTQSVTTIFPDLLKQTENFFVAHLSSKDEVNVLAKLQVRYETLQDDILTAQTPGYIRMLTRSHRFVVPVQARKFALPANAIPPPQNRNDG